MLQTAVLLLVGAAAFGLPRSVRAQDTIYVSGGSGPHGETKTSGRILDYTGRELLFELAGGVQKVYPSQKILKVETIFGQEKLDADALFSQGEFASAVAIYGQARSSDQRPWVRRLITAQMVWCHRALGQTHLAGEEFLLLIRSDPDTLYFDSIPLAWVPSQPPIPLEQAARQWLARDDLPAAVLLGASHLMSTSHRLEALERLKQLTTSADRQVASLALAQTWRATAVTADQRQLDTWQRAIDGMPREIRAGPYFVLGQAQAQRQQWEEAALSLMRIPILFARNRTLAARSLVDTGRSLEKINRSKQAVKLYDEVIKTYPKSRAAAEAQSRLEQISAEG